MGGKKEELLRYAGLKNYKQPEADYLGLLQKIYGKYMENKLQQLTDKLYNEGLSKGKKEAEQILNKAKTEAENILNNAKEEGKAIIAEAQKRGEELKLKTESDIKMAASQALAAVKEQIATSVKLAMVSKPIGAALSDVEFTKTLIKSVIEAYKPGKESCDLELVLPEKIKGEIDSFIKGELSKICSNGLSISYEHALSGGFKLSPKGSGYYIDFSDEAFGKLISEYLRPKTKKLLFG